MFATTSTMANNTRTWNASEMEDIIEGTLCVLRNLWVKAPKGSDARTHIAAYAALVEQATDPVAVIRLQDAAKRCV